jgi:hypothetical protein
MGGVQFLYESWPDSKDTAKALKSRGDIEAAFDFIKAEAPRGNFDNEQMIWIEIQLNDPSSKIFGWHPGKIKEAIANLKSSNCAVKKNSYYPLTFYDLSEQMQGFWKVHLHALKTCAVLLVGEAGHAKTPMCTILAMMVGRHYARRDGKPDEAGYRIAPDLDFFRQEAGCQTVPCIFDDGDLYDQRPKVLKSYFDITQLEAMTRERWGGCKFVRGQARFAADNSYFEKAHPTDEEWVMADVCISDEQKEDKRFEIFLDMLKGTFPTGIGLANIRAILKRSFVILNTPNFLYMRPAGLKSKINRQPGKAHYITEEAGAVLYNWIENSVKRDEQVLGRLREDEDKLADTLMKKSRVHTMSSVAASASPTGAGVSSASASSSATGTVVKVERWNLRPPSSSTIDLCSPSPKKKSRASVVDEEEYNEDDFDRMLEEEVAAQLDALESEKPENQ